MTASLNFMIKTFAKIAKKFVGLSATIVTIKRRHFLILHLEAKNAKMEYKNGNYTKNWVGSIWTAKVNSEKSTTRVKVNGPWSTAQVNESIAMTSAANWMMTWRMTQLGLTCQSDVAE